MNMKNFWINMKYKMEFIMMMTQNSLKNKQKQKIKVKLKILLIKMNSQKIKIFKIKWKLYKMRHQKVILTKKMMIQKVIQMNHKLYLINNNKIYKKMINI